jgi:hypothetical protein
MTLYYFSHTYYQILISRGHNTVVTFDSKMTWWCGPTCIGHIQSYLTFSRSSITQIRMTRGYVRAACKRGISTFHLRDDLLRCSLYRPTYRLDQKLSVRINVQRLTGKLVKITDGNICVTWHDINLCSLTKSTARSDPESIQSRLHQTLEPTLNTGSFTSRFNLIHSVILILIFVWNASAITQSRSGPF